MKAADANPNHSFNTRGRAWVMGFLIPVSIALVVATILQPSIGLGLNAAFFCMMLVVAFRGNPPEGTAS